MPRRAIAFILCIFGQLQLAGLAWADVVVVASRESPVLALRLDQVSDLYLGRLRSLPDGQTVTVIEQMRDSDVRGRFYRLLNGMTIKQLNAYWARLQFSGQVLPPPNLTDGKAVLKVIRSSRTTLGYIDANEVDDSVRVILRLKDSG